MELIITGSEIKVTKIVAENNPTNILKDLAKLSSNDIRYTIEERLTKEDVKNAAKNNETIVINYLVKYTFDYEDAETARLYNEGIIKKEEE